MPDSSGPARRPTVSRAAPGVKRTAVAAERTGGTIARNRRSRTVRAASPAEAAHENSTTAFTRLVPAAEAGAALRFRRGLRHPWTRPGRAG